MKYASIALPTHVLETHLRPVAMRVCYMAEAGWVQIIAVMLTVINHYRSDCLRHWQLITIFSDDLLICENYQP